MANVDDCRSQTRVGRCIVIGLFCKGFLKNKLEFRFSLVDLPSYKSLRVKRIERVPLCLHVYSCNIIFPSHMVSLWDWPPRQKSRGLHYCYYTYYTVCMTHIYVESLQTLSHPIFDNVICEMIGSASRNICQCHLIAEPILN